MMQARTALNYSYPRFSESLVCSNQIATLTRQDRYQGAECRHRRCWELRGTCVLSGSLQWTSPYFQDSKDEYRCQVIWPLFLWDPRVDPAQPPTVQNRAASRFIQFHAIPLSMQDSFVHLIRMPFGL